jgi:ankyrin repeat protein
VKLSLPLKLGIAVVLLFAVVIIACLLWKPMKVRYFIYMLNSSDNDMCIRGINSLLEMGEEGRKIFMINFADGEDAADMLLDFRAGKFEQDWKNSDISVLHIAALKGYARLSELLIGVYNCDIAAGDAWQATPLHDAARNGHRDVAEILINRGARMSIKDRFGNTPLHIAAQGGHMSVVRLLIENGANLNSGNLREKSPLFMAYENNEASTVRLLLDKGADINAKDDCEWTLTHHAALDGKRELARLFINKGARVNSLSYGGQTPLDVALWFKETEIAALLRAHGGKIGMEIREQETRNQGNKSDNRKSSVENP